jgi:DNA-binding transcriptional ArsR family regulator
MPEQDLIVIPDEAPVIVALEPVQNAIHSLLLLSKVEHVSGFGDWVARTASALTPEEQRRHKLVTVGFFYAIQPEQGWSSFPAYVDHLASCRPADLRDKLLAAYARIPPLSEGENRMCYGEPRPIDRDAILKDSDSYLGFLGERFDPDHLDVELETQAYSYVVDPPAMKDLIVSHLRKMWDEYLAAEWEQVKPMLQDAVRACRQVDLGDTGKIEAVERITGREMKDEKWQCVFEGAERVILVPTAHAGPYLGRFRVNNTLWVLFGARLPDGVRFHAPDLSRAEIVMRLSALADDNRLRILRLVSEQGELHSPDIMAALGLSQSATSRHLQQLSATGYLLERRCNSAKCYQLNPERVERTLQAVSSYLLGP